MDFMPQQIFCREVARQCKFALMAYEDLKQALGDFKQPRPQSPVPQYANAAQVQATVAKRQQWLEAMDEHDRMHEAARDRIWYSVQAFLAATGNISKFLWPHYRKGEERLPERGSYLRAILEVEDNSPLAPRIFRNHFEHFDARLEAWAAESPHMYIDANISCVDSINGAQPEDKLRNFDPSTFMVTFHRDCYHLPSIIEAIVRLWHKATIQAQQRASA